MPTETKSKGQLLSEKLFFSPVNCWEKTDAKTEKEIEEFAAAYKKFIDAGKTEREFTAEAVALLKKKGFTAIEEWEGKKLPPGTKIYKNIRGKSLICAVIGKKPVKNGLNILGAHIDSPRIDLKQNPLYEDTGLAFLDTHYYGGIKKYQWTTIPLAMHGVFINSKGEKQQIRIGEDDTDPVFTITDLLPHLSQDIMQKKAAEFIEGEDLDILSGSIPYKDEKVKEKVKLNILDLLNKKYGITEKNFASAEIEFVPAFKARDLGFDRSMVGAYGHDDRSCAYPALMAMINVASSKKVPNKTLVCYLSDKEEIGSAGNTGAQSFGMENFIATLCADSKELVRCLENSSMLSADVGAAFDPNYASVYEKKNVCYMGKGLVLTKYTGSRGKVGASDANAEFCSKVQAIMDARNVHWQFGELGKVDKGGGGTIALHAAKLGIEVLDCGVPVLSMHSPFEIISKIDLYTTYQGYVAFLEDM
ncbi:MAG: aminopeptidase [Treponema sp.]|jgi:aspartyl aminopeptidase|nr:aminopeptidase [Treponema sp.]